MVRAGPEAAADRARRIMEERCDRLLVHFDVDVIDFTDFPISENTGRNQGLSCRQAVRALGPLLASPKLAALTVTELNPDHAEGPESIRELAGGIATALAGSPALTA